MKIRKLVLIAFSFFGILSGCAPTPQNDQKQVVWGSVEEIYRKILNDLPPGTSRERVREYLNAQNIVHGRSNDLALGEKNQRIELAILHEVKPKQIVQRSVQIAFTFDVKDTLTEITVKELFTGP